MAQVTAQLVKELREKTGAGMMDCKAALSETNGDIGEAEKFLRKKGLKSVEKRSGKVAADGVVHSYIHAGGRIGVMLELNSETDFVARGDDFTNLAKDLAMHIAWANPKCLKREELSEADIQAEKEVFKSQLKPEQEKVADKIISGKLEKFYESVCLLDQIDARESSGKKRISDLINDVSVKVGEKIVLRRFVRYEVGEGIEKAEANFAEEVAQAAQL